jgi:hypothetical protein
MHNLNSESILFFQFTLSAELPVSETEKLLTITDVKSTGAI